MDQKTKEGKIIVGSNVITETYCKLNEHGFWEVKQTFTQRRLMEGEDEWETKTVEMNSSAQELEIAVYDAIISLEQYLSKRDSDLFKEPHELTPVVKSKNIDGEYIN